MNVLFRFADGRVVEVEDDDSPLVREFDGSEFGLVGIENGTAFYNERIA